MQPNDIARLRAEAFVGESMGNLGMFYKNTAATYERKLLEETKRMNELQQTWEKRFLAAEEAFRTQRQISLSPSFMDPRTGKPAKLFKVLDRTGKRMSYEDILKADTSGRGNIFDLGQEAKQMLETTSRSGEYQQSMSSYMARYQAEQKMLEERNAKAREAFLADKKKKLDQLSASAYKKPTYTENPL
jgi:hypothetical protein